MNTKISIIDSNGNQIIADGVSYIVLSGEEYRHEYLFYTLNEIVNGDLTKIYVAKVNEENNNIDDFEWDNVKKAMLAIVHQEDIVGLSYEKMVDETGASKTFKVDFPRKIALKMDKLVGLKDEYKLALSNPDNTNDAPAVSSTQFFDKTDEKKNEPQVVTVQNAFDGSMAPAAPAPSTPAPEPAPAQIETPAAAPVVTTPVAPAPVAEAPAVAPVVTTVVESAPVQTTAPASKEVIPPVENAPAVNNEVAKQNVTVTVTPSVAPEMKNITPSPIPNVLDGLPQVKSHSDDDSFAIPTNQVSEEDIDTVIFDQIIEELNQIKSQNAQIQESINRLTNDVNNIGNKEVVGTPAQVQNNDGMINTNTSNTSEDVSAVEFSENGSIVVPDYNQIQSSANQAVKTLTTNVLTEPAESVNDGVIIQQTAPTEVIEPSVTTVEPVGNTIISGPVTNEIINTAPPSIIDTSAPQAQVQTPAPEVVTTPPVAPAPVEPQVVTPVVEPAPVTPAPAEVTPQVINTAPAEPQIIPDVPVYGVNVPEPTIVVPEFDPNAGLPPVVMPEGVSAGNDVSALPGMDTSDATQPQ